MLLATAQRVTTLRNQICSEWGGIHYRTSVEHGTQIGRQVAEFALKTQMRPVVHLTPVVPDGTGSTRSDEDRQGAGPRCLQFDAITCCRDDCNRAVVHVVCCGA
jgi:hypothetical protein